MDGEAQLGRQAPALDKRHCRAPTPRAFAGNVYEAFPRESCAARQMPVRTAPRGRHA